MNEKPVITQTPVVQRSAYTIDIIREQGVLCGFLRLSELSANSPSYDIVPMNDTTIHIINTPQLIQNTDHYPNLNDDILQAFNIIRSMAVIEQGSEDAEEYPRYEDSAKIKYWGALVEEGSIPRDHYMIHDTDYITNWDDDAAIRHFNARLNNPNIYALEDFWDFELENIKEYLDEVDEQNKLTIDHRKGKDWYIRPPLIEHEESEFESLPGMYLTDCETTHFTESTEDFSLIADKILSTLQSWTRYVEIHGFIQNELDGDGSSLVNQYDIGRYFEDVTRDICTHIRDNLSYKAIDWTSWRSEQQSLKKEFTRLYQPLLQEAKEQAKRNNRKRERVLRWDHLKSLITNGSDTAEIEADFLACF
jgi:hypothetical protein